MVDPRALGARRVSRQQASGVRRAGVTFGITLACALSVPAAATATTIHVNEKRESATFVNGGKIPADYHDSIAEAVQQQSQVLAARGDPGLEHKRQRSMAAPPAMVLATSWRCRPVVTPCTTT